jgi:integrase
MIFRLQQDFAAAGDPNRRVTKFDLFPDLRPPEPEQPDSTDDMTLADFAVGGYADWRKAKAIDRCKTRVKQVEWWIAQLGPDKRVKDIMALSTGARKGELMQLRWEDIRFTDKRMTFYKTKNGKDREVGLTADLIVELMKHRQATGIIFHSPKDKGRPYAFRNIWEHLVKDIGFYIRFHDLQHDAATRLVNREGVSVTEAKEILGHSSVTVTERYIHPTTDTLDKQVTAMALEL